MHSIAYLTAMNIWRALIAANWHPIPLFELMGTFTRSKCDIMQGQIWAVRNFCVGAQRRDLGVMCGDLRKACPHSAA